MKLHPAIKDEGTAGEEGGGSAGVRWREELHPWIHRDGRFPKSIDSLYHEGERSGAGSLKNHGAVQRFVR